MFKKNVTASGNHQLGGKDVKTFRAAVIKNFPALTEEELTTLLPPKASVTQTKLSNRSITYSVEGHRVHKGPLFVDLNGKGDALLPTIYCLSIVPHILPTLYTWSEVSSKVMGGADLFLQGLLVPTSGVPDFLAGSIRSLSVPGNPIPFAVGSMAVSRSEALREGMKGRGLTLIHVYGDLLWQQGDKEPPNEGFKKDRVHPLPEFLEAQKQASSTNGNEGEEDDDGQSAAAAALEGLNLATTTTATANFNPDNNTVNDGQAAADTLKTTETAVEEGSSTTVDLDSLLESAVIGGLQGLKNADLPIQTSDFYTKYMQPLKPDGITFDFKQSKYKKLSRLLDMFEKEKLIKQKQVRKQDHISQVNRTHPLFVNFQGMPSGNNNNNTPGGGNSKGKAGNTSKTLIEFFYKAPASLRPVFASAAGEKDRLFTEKEVEEAFKGYAQSNTLTDGTHIKLDHVLASALWGKKEGPQEGEAVPLSVLFKRLLTKLQPWHQITRPDAAPVLRKGAIKPVTVVADRKFGRNVTTVAHVEGFGFGADELSGMFQRKFQTSCSTQPLPGKTETDMEIMLQGDLMKKVVEYLGNLGIEKQYIESSSKLKK